MENNNNTNINQKEVRMAVLVSDKVDLREKKITRGYIDLGRKSTGQMPLLSLHI